MDLSKKKRSTVTQERLSQLKDKNIVYEVACAVESCPCGKPQAGCGRGFFSLFIQAVYGMNFAKRFQIPYYINFGNNKYPYSDPEAKGDNNFWNYYFKQPIKSADTEGKYITNQFNEIYPLRIWNRPFFKRIYNYIVRKMEYTPEVASVLNEVRERFQGYSVLGVHFRGTDHYGEVPPVGLDEYLAEIDKRIKKFDRLFLATDEQYVVDLFSDKYGDKLIINDVVRSSDSDAVHSNFQNSDRYRLGLDALVDCYSLSICNSAILTHSNLSYAALFLNPELKYKLMERWKPKIKRWKTLTLFYLDKWNIRKW